MFRSEDALLNFQNFSEQALRLRVFAFVVQGCRQVPHRKKGIRILKTADALVDFPDCSVERFCLRKLLAPPAQLRQIVHC